MALPIVTMMVPVLALGFIVHICYGCFLTWQNIRARGGYNRYEVASKAAADSWSAKNMLVLGIVILGNECRYSILLQPPPDLMTLSLCIMPKITASRTHNHRNTLSITICQIWSHHHTFVMRHTLPNIHLRHCLDSENEQYDENQPAHAFTLLII